MTFKNQFKKNQKSVKSTNVGPVFTEVKLS
jgi:hypothetical protein